MADKLKAAKYFLENNYSDLFKDHANWYENVMPAMLDAYPELGTKRIVGTPRDTAAEYIGAADWARMKQGNPYDTENAAIAYQEMYRSGKNARDNIVQDKAGIALGACNPGLTREQLIPLGVKYAKENDFGRYPQYKDGGLKEAKNPMGSSKSKPAEIVKGNPYNTKGKPITDNGPSVAEVAKTINSFMPITGDIQAGIEAFQDAKKGDYGSATLNAVGVLPFVPALGGMIKNTDNLETLFHGGRKFEKWNPKMIGMGEGRGRSRPLLAQGPGLYAGNNPDLAKVYLQFGGDNPALSKLQVDNTNILNPYVEMIPEDLEKIREAKSRLDKLGLNTLKYGLSHAWLGGRYAPYDDIREALIKSKIDGLKQDLRNDYGFEYSLFNPDIIKSIEQVDPNKYKDGGLRKKAKIPTGAVTPKKAPPTIDAKWVGNKLVDNKTGKTVMQSPSLTEAAMGINNFMPITGDIQAGIQAVQDFKKGDYLSGGLNAVGLLPFMPALGGIIKNRGGNWLEGGEGFNTFDNMLSTMSEHGFGNSGFPVDDKVYSMTRDFLKNRWGTEADEVRQLLDKGISLRPDNYEDLGYTVFAKRNREREGMPIENVATSEAGKNYEDYTDMLIGSKSPYMSGLNTYETKSFGQPRKSGRELYPWLSKLPDNEKVYSIRDLGVADDGAQYMNNLGFPQIYELVQEMYDSGRMNKEQLRNLNMTKAVQLVHDRRLADEARLAMDEPTSFAKNLALPRAEEYPNGYFRVEMPSADTDEGLQEIMRVCDNTGWCTMEPVAAAHYGGGDKRLHVIFDAEGRPHNQIQTITNPETGAKSIGQIQPLENSWTGGRSSKQAKVKENYRSTLTPILQDFVNKGDYASVGNLDNAGLFDPNNIDFMTNKGYHPSIVQDFLTFENKNKYPSEKELYEFNRLQGEYASKVRPPEYRNGGEVTQPSKMNNTFMAGGLNLINPKNKSKGPLNIQWNTNNMIAASRAK